MRAIGRTITEKMWQYSASIMSGLLAAFEATVPFFMPCMIAVLLDIFAAYCLGRRVHKKYPEKADGKFKSAYKYRIFYTMIISLTLILLANYVDVLVIKDGDTAVRFVMGLFLGYQAWSIVENWSSENDNKVAMAFQRIMVNKAERHFDVKLGDILLNEKKEEKEDKDGRCK
jgi:hypothetical protein